MIQANAVHTSSYIMHVDVITGDSDLEPTGCMYIVAIL